MKKAVVLCLFLCLVLLSGCGEETSSTSTLVPSTVLSNRTEPTEDILDGYHIPGIDENYWHLLCENCDITVYLKSSGQRFVSFGLISARDMEGETITLTSDLGASVSCVIPAKSHDPEALPGYVFLAYQDLDWAALEGDSDGMYDRLAMMEDAWSTVQDMLPKLYFYWIYVAYDDLGVEPRRGEDGQYPGWEDVGTLAPQEIHSLSVTVGEETKTYELGNMLFLAENVAGNASYQGGLSIIGTMGITDYPVEPSAEGTVILPDLRFKAKADVVLQGFTVSGAEVISCDLKITTPLGSSYNLHWDCSSPVEVDEGSEILLENIIYQDPAFAGKLQANVLRYLSLNYTNGDEQFQCLIQMSAYLRCSPWDVYAWDVDGVDLMPYYTDYVNYEK